MAIAEVEPARGLPVRGTPWSVPVIVLGLTAALLGTAAAGAHRGPVEVIAGTIAVIAIGTFVLACPRAALQLSFFLVLAAATKFRERDPMALLSGDFDGQVIFELSCYAAAALAILVNLPALRRGRALPLTRTDLLLGGYVLLALVSALWSANVQVTAGRALQLGVLYVLCLVALRRLGPGPTLATLAAAVVVYVLLASGAAAVFPWAQHEHADGQFAWFASHPIDTATFAGAGALILLTSAMYAPARWGGWLRRLVLGAGLLISTAVLVAAHARAPLFAFAAAACAVWMRRYLRPSTAALALGGTVVLAGAGLAMVASSYGDAASVPGLGNPIIIYVLRGQSGDEFLGLSGRTELWGYVASLVQERPFIGHGYVASRSVLLDRFPWAGTSHGALPEVLLDLGLAGAVLLGLVFLRTLVSAFARMGPFGADGWADATVLGSLVFLIVLAVANDSFAGAPGYEVLAFFAAAIAQPHLRSVAA